MSTLNGMGLRTTEAKTADYTVVADVDNGKTFTIEGASGEVVFTLPPATVGQWFRFTVKVDQELRIDPSGTEVMSLPSSGAKQSAGAYLTANADGESLEIECVKSHPEAKIVSARAAVAEPVHPFSAASDNAVSTPELATETKPAKGASKS